jgi:hypothetical protein
MKKLVLLCTLILLGSPWLHAQQDMFKSLFVYNFTKSIDWPADYQQGDFIVAVVGKDGITEELQKLAATKKINTQNLQVVQLNNISDVPKAHIIYVSPAKNGSLASIVDYYKSKPTLVVSQKEKGCSEGAGINFILVDGKLKFEICPKNITSHHLALSPKLTALGVLIE